MFAERIRDRDQRETGDVDRLQKRLAWRLVEGLPAGGVVRECDRMDDSGQPVSVAGDVVFQPVDLVLMLDVADVDGSVPSSLLTESRLASLRTT